MLALRLTPRLPGLHRPRWVLPGAAPSPLSVPQGGREDVTVV